MKLRDLIPSEDQLKVIQGVERDLRRRRRNSLWGAVLALAGGVLNVVLAFVSDDYLEALGELWAGLVAFDADRIAQALASPELLALVVVVAAVTAWLLLRWTRFFLEESKEPFRYTFWIDAFEREDAPEDGKAADGVTVVGDDRIPRLLHHDLRERITKRIPRFSLLDPSDAEAAIDDPEALTSHIQITGSYVVREREGGDLQIQLMSRIRIGPPGKPETLAHPLRLPLDACPGGRGNAGDGARGGESGEGEGAEAAPGDDPRVELPLDRYEQLVERAYSQVATEIYRRLEQDLKGKIELFPTDYLRAVALYNEAEDLARSNTVDAYDRAVGLYREARRRLTISNEEPVTRSLIRLPLLWRTQIRYEHFWARIQIGYAKCLIYRRLISALAGRRQKALFEIPGELDDVLFRLGLLHERFHGPGWRLGGSGAERWRVQAKHVRDPTGLVRAVLAAGGDGLGDPVSREVWHALDASGRSAVEEWSEDGSIPVPPVLVDGLNAVIRGKRSLRKIPGLAGTIASAEARSLFKWDWHPRARARLNRLIVDETYAEFLENRVPYRLGTAISFLTYPHDTWWRRFLLLPSFELFKEQTRILFEAEVVAALAYHYLGAIHRAEEHLGNAEAVAPLLTDRSALYKLAAAEIETDVAKEISLFRQALALDPDFEIARYRLAQKLEVQFRIEDALTPERAERVREEYAKVLRINPGNIAALAALGHLHWLIHDPGSPDAPDHLERAREHFEDVLRLREVVRHRSEGEAHCGLARILAEEGRLAASHDHFVRAMDADPVVGAFSGKPTFQAAASALSTTGCYDFIGPSMLERFRRWEEAVADHAEKAGTPAADRAHGFALNDLGNAWFNHFLRTGVGEALDEAIDRYERAIEKDPENGIAYFNLHYAHRERGHLTGDPEEADEARKRLEKAERFAAEWPSGRVSLAQSRLTDSFKRWKDARKEARREGDDGGGAGAPETAERRSTGEPGGSTTTGAGTEAGSAPSTPGARPDVAPGRTGDPRTLKRARRELRASRARAETIVARTKLAAVQKGLGFGADGRGIERLIEADLVPGRLDEDDVAALRLWADILKTYALDEDTRPETLPVTYRVCRYIDQRFYFDSFEVNHLVKELVESLEGPAGEAGGSELPAETRHQLGWAMLKAKGVLRCNVANWLDADPVNWAALTWTDAFRYPERVEYHERAADLSPEAQKAPKLNLLGNVHHNTGAEHFEEGDHDAATECWEAAVKRYRQALDLKDDDPVYWSNLAGSYQRLERWDEAVAAMEKALDLDRGNGGYWNMLGNTHHAAERYAEAVECYLEALEVDGGNPVFWGNLAGSRRALGELDGSEEAFERAIELATDDAMAAQYGNLLGNLHHQKEEYEEAIERYRAATRLDPSVVTYWTNLAGSAEAIRRWPVAAEAYREALERDPENPTLWNNVGNVLYWDDRFQESADCYVEAIRIDGGVPVYRMNLGNAYSKLQRWDEAVDAYEGAVELNPADSQARNMLGVMYFHAGRFVDAVREFGIVVEADPSSALFRANLGNALMGMGEYEVAERVLREAIGLEAGNASYHGLLARALEGSGRRDEAEAQFERAATLDPTDSSYTLELLRLRGESGEGDGLRA